MNSAKPSWHYLRRSDCRQTRRRLSPGFTLLEVLAALAILATLLVGVMRAKGKAIRQQALAERRLEAVAAADELLSRWWENGALPVLADSGEFPLNPKLRWRTGVISAARDPQNPFDVVCLEVVGATDEQVLARVQWWAPPAVAEQVSDEAPNGRKQSTGHAVAKQ
jgi:prepilin-type N-terminal cleavage/methylation domain-containing protein